MNYLFIPCVNPRAKVTENKGMGYDKLSNVQIKLDNRYFSRPGMILLLISGNSVIYPSPEMILHIIIVALQDQITDGLMDILIMVWRFYTKVPAWYKIPGYKSIFVFLNLH